MRRSAVLAALAVLVSCLGGCGEGTSSQPVAQAPPPSSPPSAAPAPPSGGGASAPAPPGSGAGGAEPAADSGAGSESPAAGPMGNTAGGAPPGFGPPAGIRQSGQGGSGGPPSGGGTGGPPDGQGGPGGPPPGFGPPAGIQQSGQGGQGGPPTGAGPGGAPAGFGPPAGTRQSGQGGQGGPPTGAGPGGAPAGFGPPAGTRQSGPGGSGGPPAGSGFGGGPQPGGGPPGSVPGGRPPSSATRQPEGEGLFGDAEVAFAEGREKDAFQLLFALALSDDKSDVLQKIQWVPGLKRAALGVRWGVGVQLTPENFDQNVFAIGTDQTIPEVGANRRSGGRQGRGGPGGPPGYPGAPGGSGFPGGGPPNLAGGGSGGGPGGGAASGGQLQQLTGELGLGLMARLQERITNGDFGAVLQDGAELYAGPAEPSGPGPVGPGAMGPGGGAAPPPPGGGMAPGLGPPGAGSPGGGQRGRNRDDDKNVRLLSAGITRLGVGSVRELMERAEDEELDVVAIFDVRVKSNTRTNLVTNDTKLTIYDTRRGSQAELHRTKALNNIQVQKTRKEDDDEDPVEETLARLFDGIDSDAELSLKMQDLPEVIKPEHAARHVEELLASQHANPLPVLAEIKFYHARGLLTDDALTQAFQKVLGELPGAKLAQGNTEERLEAIKRYLPSNSVVEDGDDDDDKDDDGKGKGKEKDK